MSPEATRRSSPDRVCPNNWYHELVHLGCRPFAGGVPAVAAFAGGSVVKLRAVCRSMEVRSAVRRPRRTCVVAASSTRSGMAAWRCCVAVEAIAVQGNKPWRRVWRDRCVLWVRTGRVGTVARGEHLVWSGSSGASGARGMCRTHGCGRTRRTRRVRAGRAGRTGAVGLVGRVGCVRDVRDAQLRSDASGARGTYAAQRDVRRVSPAEKELGVCCRGRDGARCDRRQCVRSGP
ncbi:hypothetical protein VPH35_065689 [Triticum aestivum]